METASKSTAAPSSKAKEMPQEQVIQLRQRIDAGDNQALAELVLANLGLVHWVINKHDYYSHYAGRDDLVQIGTIGLIFAARTYDWRKGHAFSTFAHFRIRAQLYRYVVTNQFVRVTAMDKLYPQVIAPVRKHRNELMLRLYREPTVDEIVSATGLERPQVVLALCFLGEHIMSLDEIVHKGRHPIRLWELLEGELMFIDTGIEAIESGELAPERQQMPPQYKLALSRLKPKERRAIELLFGLSGPPLQVGQVAHKLRVSQRTVFRLRQRALAKLADSELAELVA